MGVLNMTIGFGNIPFKIYVLKANRMGAIERRTFCYSALLFVPTNKTSLKYNFRLEYFFVSHFRYLRAPIECKIVVVNA